MRRLISLLGVIFLSACGTDHPQNTPGNRWVGRPITSLQLQWGQPDNTIKQANSNTLYIYHTESKYRLPSTNPGVVVTTGQNGKSVGVEIPQNTPTFTVTHCTMLFEANKQGIIINAKYNGTNCP